MSAPLSPESSRRVLRPGAVAFRYAGVAPAGDDVMRALGVRHDDEDRRFGDACLLSFGPGRAKLLAQLPFAARRLGATLADGSSLVLDAEDGLWRVDVDGTSSRVLGGVRCVYADLVVTVDGGVYRGPDFSAPVVTVPGATVGVHGPGDTILIATNDSVSLWADDTLTRLVHTDAPPTALCWWPPSKVTDDRLHPEGWTLAVGTEQSLERYRIDQVHAARGGAVAAGPGTAAMRESRLEVPHPVRSLACFAGALWYGDAVRGLWRLELDNDPGTHETAQLVRPSLRAHQLWVTPSALLIASDLQVAQSDGVDFLSRDLSSFTRLAPIPQPG